MLTFNKPTLVTITAPTCGGKNYLRNFLEKQFGWNRIVGTTTRPMRAGEVEGVDYFFLTDQKSREIEAAGDFAELIVFRGVRYGITKKEMDLKMNFNVPATLILEPSGLAEYKKLCAEHNWDLFSIFISTTEAKRIDRLNARTMDDIVRKSIDLGQVTASPILTHTDRLISIMTEERTWHNTNIWSVTVPGDNLDKALEMVEAGVKWRNHQTSTPTAYDHQLAF